jgi:hypothetical protein
MDDLECLYAVNVHIFNWRQWIALIQRLFPSTLILLVGGATNMIPQQKQCGEGAASSLGF